MDAERFENPAWHVATPRILHRIWRAALKDLAILLIIVALGEIGVRLLLPNTSRYIFGPTITGGHPIRYNSYGLRDVEFRTTRSTNERRILCTGDSTTFGAGLPPEETYPKQLDQLLNARSVGNRWLVINAGGQGSSVSMLLEFLQKKGVHFDPSVVILGFSATMLSVAGRRPNSGTFGDPPGEKEEPLPSSAAVARAIRREVLDIHVWLHSSYLYVLFDTQVRRRLYRLGVIRDRMDARDGAIFAYAFNVPGVDVREVERAYRVLHEELRQVKRFLDKRQIVLIVLGLPSRFRISDHWLDNERGYNLSKIRVEPLDRVAIISEELGIPFVDLRPRLSQERQAMLRGTRQWDDLFIPTDYAHLNAAGMRLAAEELLRALDTRVRTPTASNTNVSR